MLTYQDFLAAPDRAAFIAKAIQQHMSSALYLTARDADLYNQQRNVTINRVSKTYYNAAGQQVPDEISSNNRLASNYFKHFNRQRCSYLMGNGVSFTRMERRVNDRGIMYNADVIKETLGEKFDVQAYRWAYKALTNGRSFGFWDSERLYVFPVTSFVPLYDEDDGSLQAGIRFWRLDSDKPWTAELYETEGVTTYRTRARSRGMDFVAQTDEPVPYAVQYVYTEAEGDSAVGAVSYSRLPVIEMRGNEEGQSTLTGLRAKIDAYDLIQSGFCNTLEDCSEIYWIIQNCGAMTQKDIKKFMDDIRLRHIASVDTKSFDGDAKSGLSPYVQDVPYQARKAFLDDLRASMYEDFGAVDVHALSAGSTNDHIDAAYQPLEDACDEFEVQVIDAIQQLLALMGIEDTPQFKRNRSSNVKETIEAIMLEANYLDEETVLELLPNLTVDQKDAVMQRRAGEDAERLRVNRNTGKTGDSEQETGIENQNDDAQTSAE